MYLGKIREVYEKAAEFAGEYKTALKVGGLAVGISLLTALSGQAKESEYRVECPGGKCVCEEPGEKRCDDNILQKCIGEYWEPVATCEYGCIEEPSPHCKIPGEAPPVEGAPVEPEESQAATPETQLVEEPVATPKAKPKWVSAKRLGGYLGYYNMPRAETNYESPTLDLKYEGAQEGVSLIFPLYYFTPKISAGFNVDYFESDFKVDFGDFDGDIGVERLELGLLGSADLWKNWYRMKAFGQIEYTTEDVDFEFLDQEQKTEGWRYSADLEFPQLFKIGEKITLGPHGAWVLEDLNIEQDLLEEEGQNTLWMAGLPLTLDNKWLNRIEALYLTQSLYNTGADEKGEDENLIGSDIGYIIRGNLPKKFNWEHYGLIPLNGDFQETRLGFLLGQKLGKEGNFSWHIEAVYRGVDFDTESYEADGESFDVTVGIGWKIPDVPTFMRANQRLFDK